jgi:hypothetical protein
MIRLDATSASVGASSIIAPRTSDAAGQFASIVEAGKFAQTNGNVGGGAADDPAFSSAGVRLFGRGPNVQPIYQRGLGCGK